MPKFLVRASRVTRVVERAQIEVEATSKNASLDLAEVLIDNIDDLDLVCEEHGIDPARWSDFDRGGISWREDDHEVQDYSYDAEELP